MKVVEVYGKKQEVSNSSKQVSETQSCKEKSNSILDEWKSPLPQPRKTQVKRVESNQLHSNMMSSDLGFPVAQTPMPTRRTLQKEEGLGD
jgi:hypothetical protein